MKKYVLLFVLLIADVSGRDQDNTSTKVSFMAGAFLGTYIQGRVLLKGLDLLLPSEPAARSAILGFIGVHCGWQALKSLAYTKDVMEGCSVSDTDGAIFAFVEGLKNNLMVSPRVTITDLKDGIRAPFVGTSSHEEDKKFQAQKSDTTFADVIGADDAKTELSDIVEFLKNPEKFNRLGGKISKGVLLVGPSGNGKTLLARAVAGEANCPFFCVAASELVEMYVGLGAKRVRDLFREARKEAPCIIFIDEVDTIGGKRGMSMTHGEIENTLNQLLIEMDGFNKQDPLKPIIVIAATNRPDILDEALIRPGRFDRQIAVTAPNLAERKLILELYAQKIIADASINLEKIAQNTIGFSGADLANLINQAAVSASKAGKSAVSQADLVEARDLVILGRANLSRILTNEEKRITAFHESGHALVGILLPHSPYALHKVTIVPRGAYALGVTTSVPDYEKYIYTKEELISRIMVCLGGRIAEQIEFGIISSGASNDFEQATRIARTIVCHYGMSEKMGPISYTDSEGRMANLSEKTIQEIDAEVAQIMHEAYTATHKLLSDNRELLTKLSLHLLEKETLDATEVYELLTIHPEKLNLLQ